MPTIFAEAITLENVSAFETPATWNIVYEPWHGIAVESHKTFCALTHANEGENYTEYTEGMALNNVATWVSSLKELPIQIDKHRLTSDVMTTMVLDLEYHRLDVQLIEGVEIILAKVFNKKMTGLRLNQLLLEFQNQNLRRMFNDVFADTSNQYELNIISLLHRQCYIIRDHMQVFIG